MFNMFGGMNPFAMMGGGPQMGQQMRPVADTSEQVRVSGLALLKMLKHCRAGVPFEVMGVMLGEIEDDYTITCVDVFAMPQLATTVSVEAIDPTYQIEYIQLMEQVGRKEKLVGWYHSHPGFGCWLSMTDIVTQKSFEAQEYRSVAVVIDPVQSVKGRVLMDAFRAIPPNLIAFGAEPRITTSNEGQLRKADLIARLRGLDKIYYSVNISSRTHDDLEQTMLLDLHKKVWHSPLQRELKTQPSEEQNSKDNLKVELEGESQLLAFDQEQKGINQILKRLKTLTQKYQQQISKEAIVEKDLLFVGRQNVKKHIEEECETLHFVAVTSVLSTMINSVAF